VPSYRSIVADRRWRRLALASLAARLPITMAAFGCILAGRALGSYALGARLAAAYTLTAALAALWQGRRLDRADLRTGLVRQGVAVAVTAAALAVMVQARGPWWAAAALAVALGVAMAAVGGGYRALLPRTLAGADLEVASALDAVCVELCFVVGPAVAAAVAWFAGAPGVFATVTACAALGAAATRRLAPTPRRERAAGTAHVPALYSRPEVIAVAAGAVGLGTALGALEGVFPAFAAHLGTRASAGGAFAALNALGSGLAGLLIGSRLARRRSLGRVSIALLGTFGLLTLPVAVAPDLPVAVVAVLVGGAPFALMATAGSLIIQRAVPEDRAAEAFSLLNAAILTGAAAGNALVSLLIASAGVRATLATAGAAPVLVAAGLAAVTAARGRRPAAVAPEPEAVAAGR
jgi:MFS family permease